jgi:TPR repeat protein
MAAAFVAVSLAGMSGTAASAAPAEPDTLHLFPGEAPDARTIETRQQVESLYSAGEFKRALLIYRKELAPKGDKYAQYMVGYMLLHGQGVKKDPAAALAWYRLAAERIEGVLAGARDELEQTLDAGEHARADAIFARLLQQYGDHRLLVELIRDDLAILRGRNGSAAGEAQPRVTIVTGYMGNQGAADVYRRVRERLDRRIEYLEHAAHFAHARDGGGDSSLSARNQTLEEIRKSVEALDTP